MSQLCYVPGDIRTTAAVQVLHSGATLLLAASGKPQRFVHIYNLGPNKIYLGWSSGVTEAGGYPVGATTGEKVLEVRQGVAIYAIAATADQVAGADTRVMVLG